MRRPSQDASPRANKSNRRLSLGIAGSPRAASNRSSPRAFRTSPVGSINSSGSGSPTKNIPGTPPAMRHRRATSAAPQRSRSSLSPGARHLAPPMRKTHSARGPLGPKSSNGTTRSASRCTSAEGGMGSSAGAGAVVVSVRLRPQNRLEEAQKAFPCVSVSADQRTVEVDGDHMASGLTSDYRFTFDRAFDVQTEQEEVYAYMGRPLVLDLINGYNCSMLAYGQTGSGKTFSMMGEVGNRRLRGVIPRIADDIFEYIHASAANLEYTVRVSFVEIYLEALHDLLGSRSSTVRVREDRGRGVYIQGAIECYVGNREEMLQLIQRGSSNRVIASTKMNTDSSRSHSVFIITVEQKDINTNSKKSGCMYLVDLAGSEMISKTQAQGQTLQEAKMINKSLSALGNVIKALTEGSRHVPYRDSKLTRILQDSLGGNSKTALIITCSCSSYNVSETLSTIRFGTRAKKIQNKPKVNQEISASEYKKLLDEAKKREKEIKSLMQAMATELESLKNPRDVVPVSNLVSDEEGELGPLTRAKVGNTDGQILALRDLLTSFDDLDKSQEQSAESSKEDSQSLYLYLKKVLDAKAEACTAAENAKELAEDLVQQKDNELAECKELNLKLQEDVENLNKALKDASQKERALQQNILELKLQMDKMDQTIQDEERKRLHADTKRDKRFLKEGKDCSETISELSWPSTKTPEYIDEASSHDSITLGPDEHSRSSSYENVMKKDWEAASGMKLPVPPLPDVSGMKTTREEELEKDLMQLMAQHMELRKEHEVQKESMGSFFSMINQKCSTSGAAEGTCDHVELVTDLALENKELKQSLENKSQKHHQVVVRLSKSINRTSRLERILKSRDSMVKTLEATVQQMQRDLRATLEENQIREQKLREKLEWFNSIYGGEEFPRERQFSGSSNSTFSSAYSDATRKRTSTFSMSLDGLKDNLYNRIIKPIRGGGSVSVFRPPTPNTDLELQTKSPA